MKRKNILFFVPLLLLMGCASNKLNQTVWYNLTMMQENGVMGNVGTSLIFNTDSTVVVYKGVSIDTNVIVAPFIFAYGTYQYEKIDGHDMKISVSAITKDGNPYVYTGQYNKKEGLMRLNKPNSELKETYIWNPDAK
jgi:hypothetical protein